MENGASTPPNGELEPSLDKAPTSASASAPATAGHRRSASGGNSIFSSSRFTNFLRTNSEEKLQVLASPLSSQSHLGAQSNHDPNEAYVSPPGQHYETTPRAGAMASAVRSSKMRKRKGSLRKTALLGGKMRRSPITTISAAAASTMGDDYIHDDTPDINPQHAADEPAQPLYQGSNNHRVDSDGQYDGSVEYESASTSSSFNSLTLPPPLTAPLTINTLSSHNNTGAISPPSTTPSPITSPISRYASTTDDDEGLTMLAPNLTSAADLTRRRSARSAHVQTNSLVVAPHQPSEHDYSDTEWWGWIILIITWIVFVVGMGSCLGVWSWAWDVGETPYAPPELEDDPTLPIVGYYPALIILTAVMAWVWVVVAWVGMKYFRHARFVDGEE